MKTKQLSIFLENKSGRLTEVTDALGAAGINLSAIAGIFFVASPMIERLRVTALFNVSSCRNSSLCMSSFMTERT